MARVMADFERVASTVPVFIDSVKRYEGFQMTRCSFLEIDSEEPLPGWSLGLGGQQVEFLLLGLSGIVTSPVEGGLFNAPEQIDKLYDVVESAGLSINSASIFVPNFLCPDEKDAVVGSVMRVNAPFFALAHRHAAGGVSNDEIQRIGREEALDSVKSSPKETLAFRAWHELEIRSLREQFPKREGLELGWKGGSTT